MFTCVTCHLVFALPKGQIEHFQTEWHRYNLKRKVAELPPVSAELFQEKLLALQPKPAEVSKPIYCPACKKVFANKHSFDNHAKSKKHLQNEKKKKDLDVEEGKKTNLVQTEVTKIEEEVKKEEDDDEDDEDDMEIEEVDSDEWEGDALAETDCLFCPLPSRSMERNIKHMTLIHSFYIPDLEYCTDVHSLIKYLGKKVGCGMQCLWCNEKSRNFFTVDSVQRHMRDKGHTNMKFEGESLLEYSQFYDYSSSYPDAETGVSPGEEIVPFKTVTSTDGYELVLPSGKVIGHRSLLRYYKQYLKPYRSLAENRSSTQSLHYKIMSQYRSIGWKGASPSEVAKKARDVNYMKSIQAKQWMRLGVKANKLQPYLRQQVLF